MEENSIKVKGSFRLAIAQDGEVISMGDWHDNLVVNLGYYNYIVAALGGLAGSRPTITHMALGTGAAPSATDTTLPGELGEAKRAAVTAASSAGSKAVLFTATFASSVSFATATRNLANVALVNSSGAGSIFAGNTYASSAVATNQDVYASYAVTLS
jgi:hypothetical protein